MVYDVCWIWIRQHPPHLIQACGAAGDLGMVFVVRAEMDAAGVSPTAGTFNALSEACRAAGDLGKAFEVRAEMVAAGVRPTAGTFAALIQASPRVLSL